MTKNMVNAQKWLYKQEKYNTPEKREKVENLDISNQNLEGKLILTGFKNLKKLNCSHNQITSLDLTDSSKSLEELVTNDNQLSRLIFDTSDPTKLKTLNLVNNKFHNNHSFWNFTFLFRNLNYLDLRNSGIKQGLVDDISYIEKVSLDDGEWKRQVSSEKEKRERNLANYLKENPGREEDYYQTQTWLDFNYPKEERSKIKEVIINGYWEWTRLKGNLDLRDFTSLEKLNIQFNWGITGCDITLLK